MTLRGTGTSERMGTELSDETRIQTRETGIHVSVSDRAFQNSKDLNAPLGRLNTIFREFDPGSGRTLAACLTHASRTDERELAPSS